MLSDEQAHILIDLIEAGIDDGHWPEVAHKLVGECGHTPEQVAAAVLVLTDQVEYIPIITEEDF